MEKSWKYWSDELLRLHDTEAIRKYWQEHKEDVEAMQFSQYIFYKQFLELKQYANERDIQLIGDIPFYIGVDSADVWAHRELFCVDTKDGTILEYGGIPNKNAPDTNWGNPCYNWKHHKEDGFAWWRQRIRFFSKYYNALRIDHAVGMMHYYSISANSRTGIWKTGPDIDGAFTQMIANESTCRGVDIILEDLGEVPFELRERMNELGFCGMRILQYAYSNKYFAHSYHLPNHAKNSPTSIGGEMNWHKKLSLDNRKKIEYT